MYSPATSQEPQFSQKENKVRHPYWCSRNCRFPQVGSIVANMENLHTEMHDSHMWTHAIPYWGLWHLTANLAAGKLLPSQEMKALHLFWPPHSVEEAGFGVLGSFSAFPIATANVILIIFGVASSLLSPPDHNDYFILRIIKVSYSVAIRRR